MTRVFDQEDSPEQPRGEPPAPRLALTTRRQLVVAALTGVVVAYFVIATFEALDQTVPITPWTLAALLATLAGVGWYYARTLRRRIEENRAAVTNEEGVRALVFGKTMSVSGAFLAGAHVLYVLRYINRLQIPGPRERVIMGLLTIVGSAGFALAGLALERACVAPPADEDADRSASVPEP